MQYAPCRHTSNDVCSLNPNPNGVAPTIMSFRALTCVFQCTSDARDTSPHGSTVREAHWFWRCKTPLFLASFFFVRVRACGSVPQTRELRLGMVLTASHARRCLERFSDCERRVQEQKEQTATAAPLSPPPWRFRPSVFARTERTSMRSLGSMIPPRCTAWSVRSPSVCVCAASHLRPSVAQPRGDVRAAVGTEQAPAGRGGAQRLPRSARGCRRRPQRQVASRRNCALRQLRAAF